MGKAPAGDVVCWSARRWLQKLLTSYSESFASIWNRKYEQGGTNTDKWTRNACVTSRLPPERCVAPMTFGSPFACTACETMQSSSQSERSNSNGTLASRSISFRWCRTHQKLRTTEKSALNSEPVAAVSITLTLLAKTCERFFEVLGALKPHTQLKRYNSSPREVGLSCQVPDFLLSGATCLGGRACAELM